MCRKYYDLELHEKQQAAKAAKKGKAAADDEVRLFGRQWLVLALCWQHAGRVLLRGLPRVRIIVGRPTWQA